MRTKPNANPAIGFPPGLLGSEACRLPVLWHAEGLLAIQKPCGVLVEPDPWWPAVPNLRDALRSQTEADKPELRPYALEKPRAVFNLPPDVPGIACFGTNSDASARLRDAWGSCLWKLRFSLLAEVGEGVPTEAFSCDLPLVRETDRPEMRVSHRKGKRTQTAFLPVAAVGTLRQWRAEMSYLRLLQVRTHARENGLRIVGDAYTGGPGPLTAGGINPDLRGPGRDHVYWDGPCLWLEEVVTETMRIPCPLPHGLGVLLKKLGQG